jgi:hypothetical protein
MEKMAYPAPPSALTSVLRRLQKATTITMAAIGEMPRPIGNIILTRKSIQQAIRPEDQSAKKHAYTIRIAHVV